MYKLLTAPRYHHESKEIPPDWIEWLAEAFEKHSTNTRNIIYISTLDKEFFKIVCMFILEKTGIDLIGDLKFRPQRESTYFKNIDPYHYTTWCRHHFVYTHCNEELFKTNLINEPSEVFRLMNHAITEQERPAKEAHEAEQVRLKNIQKAKEYQEQSIKIQAMKVIEQEKMRANQALHQQQQLMKKQENERNRIEMAEKIKQEVARLRSSPETLQQRIIIRTSEISDIFK